MECDNASPPQLRMLHSSIGDAVRSIVVAENEFSLISKLPPETLANISEFVAEPRTRESMFEIVKMTHVCQYWRSTLISYPHLWSSIFVKNDHKDFVAACLERSREAPLAVRLDLKYGGYGDYPDCTCIRDEWSPRMRVNENNPCRYHTTIDPLLEDNHIERIRTLDVHLAMLDNVARDGPNKEFKDALDDSQLFAFPLPALENLSFHVDHQIDDIDTRLVLPMSLFRWAFFPPTQLRHLTLHNCYGGPIRAVCNLTSFELAGDVNAFDRIKLNQRTFLPFLSGNPSLVSLSLAHCNLPDRTQLSRVTPIKLPELKSLRLMDIYGFPSFPGLVDVPAFKTLSSLWISVQKRAVGSYGTDILVHAESDGGFQLSYDTSPYEVTSDWFGVMDDADPSLAFVRFEGRGLEVRGNEEEASPLSLFVNAKVLEIGVSFADLWYHDFWKDVGKVGPQLTTLRLEVTEGMKPAVAKSVRKLVRERFNKGMPLAKLERMRFGEISEEAEEKAKGLWDEFWAGLDVDQYLVPQRVP